MRLFHQMQGPQYIGFAGAGRPTPLIYATHRAFRGQNDGTAGCGFKILGVANLHAGNVIQ
jgi:hypothetical protein